MPTLDEMLASTQLTDDIKIALPNGNEVTVGELRAYAAAQRAASDKALKEYNEAKAKAVKLAEDATKLWTLAEEKEAALAKAGGSKPAPTGDIDWDNDPVYRPVGKRFSEITPQFDELRKELKAMKDALAAGFGFVTSDYYERQWNSIPADQRPKDKTWRDYLDEAKKQNLKNQFGLDDPIEAYNRSTAADRRAAEIKAAKEAGIKEGEKRAAAANITRPGSTPTLRKPADKSPYKDLNDAFAAAMNDPEIARIANGEDALA